MIDRMRFRTAIASKLGVKPPKPRAYFDMEWMGGEYCPKSKNEIYFNFGKRTPDLPASFSCSITEPPYAIEFRNFIIGGYKPTDEEFFTIPAKFLGKCFIALELPLVVHMKFDDFKPAALEIFPSLAFGPERRYRSLYTLDPYDWSRGYIPQPDDIGSCSVAYLDGLLCEFYFWKKELNGIKVTDIEIVAMNNVENGLLPEVDLERTPRSFEAALELLNMEEALRSLRGLPPTPLEPFPDQSLFKSAEDVRREAEDKFGKLKEKLRTEKEKAKAEGRPWLSWKEREIAKEKRIEERKARENQVP